jgi:predicted nucleic acid-binding protein
MATKSEKKVIYDANSIIYYCFMHEEKIKGKRVVIRVMGLTNRIQSLTEQFLTEGFEIETISGVMKEIFDKGIAKIVDEFCDDYQTKSLIGLPERAKISSRIRLRLARKTEEKIRRLQNKAWFKVIDYHPDERELRKVKDFYLSLSGTLKMEEHMRKKRTRVPYPSDIDMALLTYSKKTGAQIVTNDSDLTDFKEELERAGFCSGIIIVP